MKFRVCDLHQAIKYTSNTMDDLENIYNESTLKFMRYKLLRETVSIGYFEVPNATTKYAILDIYLTLSSDATGNSYYNAVSYEDESNVTIRYAIGVLENCIPNVIKTYLALDLSLKELSSILSIMEDEVEYIGKPKKQDIPALDCLKYYMKYVKSTPIGD